MKNGFSASKLSAVGPRSGEGVFDLRDDIPDDLEISLTDAVASLILISIDIFDADRH